MAQPSSTFSIVPHRDSWKDDFENEAALLRRAFGSALTALHHIGSTAVPGLPAKPVIDILAEFTDLPAADACSAAMQALGYEVMGEFGIAGRRYYRKKGASGKRTHQVHGFVSGTPDVARHLAFRGYLRCHPGTVLAYGVLKLRLLSSTRGDIEAYMDGKDAFVKEVEQRALAWAEGER